MRANAGQIYQSTRGKELAGTYNHVLISELFHEQSSRWEALVNEHVQRIVDLVENYIANAFKFIIKDDNVRLQLSFLVAEKMDQNTNNALEEVRSRLKDESSPQPTSNNNSPPTI